MGLPAGAVHRTAGDRVSRASPRKEPVPGAAHPPPVAQDLEQLRGQHHVAIFLTLALLDAEDHPLAVDRRDGEVNGFRDAEAGGVAGREDGVMLGRLHRVEKLDHFGGAEHHRQALVVSARGSRPRPTMASGG